MKFALDSTILETYLRELERQGFAPKTASDVQRAAWLREGRVPLDFRGYADVLLFEDHGAFVLRVERWHPSTQGSPKAKREIEAVVEAAQTRAAARVARRILAVLPVAT